MQEEGIAKLSTPKYIYIYIYIYILGMPSPMMSPINLMQKHKANNEWKTDHEGNNNDGCINHEAP